MANEKTSRNTLRENLLKTQITKGKIVTIENLQYEIRRLSIRERNDIIAKARDKNDKGDVTYLQVMTVIATCYVPRTQEKVFEFTDYDALAASQESGVVDTLYAAYSEASQNIDVSDALLKKE